jgi:hypothetical protein
MPNVRAILALTALALVSCARAGSARNDRSDASPEAQGRVREINRDLTARRVIASASEMQVAPNETLYVRRLGPDADALERVTAEGQSSVLARCSTHLVFDLGDGGARWVCWDKGRVEAYLESAPGRVLALRGPAGGLPDFAHSSLCGDVLYTLGDSGLVAIPLDGTGGKVLNDTLRPTECPGLFCRQHPVRRVGDDLFVVQSESIVRVSAGGGPSVPVAKLAPPGRALEPRLYGLIVADSELFFGVLDAPGAQRAGHDVIVATERGTGHTQLLSRIMGGFAADLRFVYWSDCFGLRQCGVYRKVRSGPVREVERLAVTTEVASQIFVEGTAVLYAAQGSLWRIQLSP